TCCSTRTNGSARWPLRRASNPSRSSTAFFARWRARRPPPTGSGFTKPRPREPSPLRRPSSLTWAGRARLVVGGPGLVSRNGLSDLRGCGTPGKLLKKLPRRLLEFRRVALGEEVVQPGQRRLLVD